MRTIVDSKVMVILRELNELLYKLELWLQQNKISSLPQAIQFATYALTIRCHLTELQQLRSGADFGDQAVDIAQLIRKCKDIEGMAKEARNDLCKAEGREKRSASA
jgi:hypothetical protein